ncbi:MAG TPA: M56 family metallopeptidase [Candidatus Pygmaiobacter gallistercoris]|nr:M56 family metallopeptidase [Candidatus Pygmaiobacter gallistercoris]
MSQFFLTVLNRSIAASWLVVAVLLLRPLLRRVSGRIVVALWGMVGIRLVSPFLIESAVSLIPNAETVAPGIMTDSVPEIDTGIAALNQLVNPVLSGSLAPDPAASANPLQIWIPVCSLIWAAGVAGMVLYALLCSLGIKRRIAAAVRLRDNIYQSEEVVSPFVLGVVRPKIYLPFGEGRQMEEMIAHEQAHIRRRDPLWKLLGFLILAVYWFNPLIWLCYALLCRDIELACDEKVIQTLDAAQRADYAQTLLRCSTRGQRRAAGPLAFGEVAVKERVKAVLRYRRPAFWLRLVAAAAVAAVGLCFLTNPRATTTLNGNLSSFVVQQIAAHHRGEKTGNHFVAVDYQVLGTDQSGKETTVYLWVLYQEYSGENGALRLESSAHIPTVITAKEKEEQGRYALVEYWEPRDDPYYAEDLREKFPWYLYDKALDAEGFIDLQQRSCEDAAEEYFSARRGNSA